MRGWIEAVLNQVLPRMEPDGAWWDMDIGWEMMRGWYGRVCQRNSETTCRIGAY